MLASSVAVRSLVLAVLGLGAASAMAQSQGVTAFNPYNGVGLPGGPPAAASLQAAPTTGMAFNPWRPTGVTASWGSSASPAYVPYYERGADRGADLPPPPPGPIESRIVAIPELGSRAGARRGVPAPAVAPSTPPAVVTASVAPAPAQTVAAPPATPAAPPVAAPAPPTRSAAVAPTPPAPEPPPTPRPAAATALATIEFARQSAEIGAAARAELDRVAKTVANARQIEVRAFATGPDAADARKIALARALVVRSYLIDQGVKARIEVGAYAADARGASERVDIVAPGT